MLTCIDCMQRTCPRPATDCPLVSRSMEGLPPLPSHWMCCCRACTQDAAAQRLQLELDSLQPMLARSARQMGLPGGATLLEFQRLQAQAKALAAQLEVRDAQVSDLQQQLRAAQEASSTSALQQRQLQECQMRVKHLEEDKGVLLDYLMVRRATRLGRGCTAAIRLGRGCTAATCLRRGGGGDAWPPTRPAAGSTRCMHALSYATSKLCCCLLAKGCSA